MTKYTPTLGILLRATRNYFYYSEDLKAYLRMRLLDETKGLFEIEICQPKYLINKTSNKRGKNALYIKWNNQEGEGKKIVSDLISKIRNTYRNVSAYRKFKFNLEGELVQ